LLTRRRPGLVPCVSEKRERADRKTGGLEAMSMVKAATAEHLFAFSNIDFG